MALLRSLSTLRLLLNISEASLLVIRIEAEFLNAKKRLFRDDKPETPLGGDKPEIQGQLRRGILGHTKSKSLQCNPLLSTSLVVGPSPLLRPHASTITIERIRVFSICAHYDLLLHILKRELISPRQFRLPYFT